MPPQLTWRPSIKLTIRPSQSVIQLKVNNWVNNYRPGVIVRVGINVYVD